MNSFQKILFTLCIVLLSGYGQLHAQYVKENPSSVSIEKGVQSPLSIFEHSQNDQLSIIGRSTTAAQRMVMMEIAEFEEEESEGIGLKKIKDPKHFATLIYTLVLLSLFGQVRKSTTLERLFLNAVPCRPRYILFQVFRI